MSASSSKSKTDLKTFSSRILEDLIFPPEVLENFEYLLSLYKKEVAFLDRNLEADHRIIDTVIETRYPFSEYYYLRQHIIRSGKELFELYFRIEELEKILETRTIRKDSQFYPLLDINSGNIDSLLSNI